LSKELEVAGQFDQMNSVVIELLKGNNPTAIAKSLGLTRAKVMTHIDTWKEFAKDNNGIRARAKEALLGADEHYNELIRELWVNVRAAEGDELWAIKNQGLKLIGDLEKNRIEMLSKAGVLENDNLAHEVLESERKQEILVNILKEVTAKCDHCKFEVASRLSQVTGQIESVRVD
jgi:hypothetical protein